MRAEDLSFKELEDYEIGANVTVVVQASSFAEAERLAFEHLQPHCESIDILAFKRLLVPRTPNERES